MKWESLVRERDKAQAEEEKRTRVAKGYLHADQVCVILPLVPVFVAVIVVATAAAVKSLRPICRAGVCTGTSVRSGSSSSSTVSSSSSSKDDLHADQVFALVLVFVLVVIVAAVRRLLLSPCRPGVHASTRLVVVAAATVVERDESGGGGGGSSDVGLSCGDRG